MQWSRLVCQKGDCVVSAQLLEKNIPLSFPHCFFFFILLTSYAKGGKKFSLFLQYFTDVWGQRSLSTKENRSFEYMLTS